MPKRSAQDPDSYYLATSNPRPDRPALTNSIEVDVAIIGGGITGCSTALHLARQGQRVAVLEQRFCGWGASGRSGGQIIHGYACDLAVIARQQGKDHARRLWQHSLDAVSFTCDIVAQHTIDCDLTMGYLHVGVRPRHARALAQWAASLAQDYGFTAMEYLERSRLSEILASPRYSAGVFDPASGHLHPLNYTLGLADAARNAGAEIYESTAVNAVRKVGQGYYIDCAGAQVTSHEVVYACNAYLAQLAPDIGRCIMPVGTYIIATQPLSEQTASGLISNRAAVADSNFVLDYYRLSADNRLLFGGRVSYSTLPPRGLTESLRRRMIAVFPQLADVRIDYSWGGYVAITRNRAPHAGRTQDGAWFAQGYSGHGMALSGYLGRLMAQAILGDDDGFADFAALSHRAFPGGRLLRMPTLVAAMSYYRLQDLL